MEFDLLLYFTFLVHGTETRESYAYERDFTMLFGKGEKFLFLSYDY